MLLSIHIWLKHSFLCFADKRFLLSNILIARLTLSMYYLNQAYIMPSAKLSSILLPYPLINDILMLFHICAHQKIAYFNYWHLIAAIYTINTLVCKIVCVSSVLIICTFTQLGEQQEEGRVDRRISEISCRSQSILVLIHTNISAYKILLLHFCFQMNTVLYDIIELRVFDYLVFSLSSWWSTSHW